MLFFVLTTKFRTSTSVFGGYFCLYFARIIGYLCVRLYACLYAYMNVYKLCIG